MDIKPKDDKIMVKMLRNPSDLAELQSYLSIHKQMLEEVKLPQSRLLLFDIRALVLDVYALTVYIPTVILHFVAMRKLSDLKLSGCSVCVGSEKAANIIQEAINANPGKVPTLISQDFEACKTFLASCRKKLKKQ
jgi:hypothetical protein